MDDETDAWTRRDGIFQKTRERLTARTTREWLEIFREHDIWAGPVSWYADLVDDPQVTHNGTFVEVQTTPPRGTSGRRGFQSDFRRPPPPWPGARRWPASTRATCCARPATRKTESMRSSRREQSASIRMRRDPLSRSDMGPSARGSRPGSGGAKARSRAGRHLYPMGPAAARRVRVAPIADLCARYDLVVLDHPHVGEAAGAACLRPLEALFLPEEIADWAAQTIGPCLTSYRYAGAHWALPLDAATQVLAWGASVQRRPSGHMV